jgi:hypothetical protein
VAEANKSVGIPGIAESRDQALLALAFIVGAAGIVAMKSLELPNKYPIGLTVFVLLAYAMAMRQSQRTKIEPETIGDNCYYLGFLFTLTSLAVVLFKIGGVGNQTDLPNVISGFGLALTSTIFGVLLRILFMQARTDLVAHDVEARRDLLSATRDFRASLALSTSEMKAFSTEVAQLAFETVQRLKEVSEKADAIQKEAAEKATELQWETTERLAAIERAMAEKVAVIHREAAERAASVSMSAIEARLSQGASLLQESVREAATAASREAAQAVGKEIERGADVFRTQYEVLSAELRRQADSLRGPLETLVDLRAEAAEQMAAVANQVEALAHAATAAGTAMRSLEPGVEAAKSALAGGLMQVAGKLSSALEQLAEESDATRDALMRLRENDLGRRSVWRRLKGLFRREDS